MDRVAGEPPGRRANSDSVTGISTLWNGILQIMIRSAAASLVDVAAGLAAATQLLGSPAPPPAMARSWVRLCATDEFDAWLISWPPGGAVEFHDHGSSAGAFVVVRGSLVEVEPGRRGTTRRRRLPEGSRRAVASERYTTS
jgi:hypothetical protein